MFHVMVSLADGDRHGYRIMKDVAHRTGGRVDLSTGTLYGIIKRLLDDGLAIEVRADDERRRTYRLTPFGRAVIAAETERLEAAVASARASRLLREKGRP
jgi:DNA-binding PadR family transcriptional regulator